MPVCDTQQAPQVPQSKTVSFASTATSGTKPQQPNPATSNILEVLQPIQTQAPSPQFIPEPPSNGEEYGAEEFFEDQYGSLNPNPATFSHNNPAVIATAQSSLRPKTQAPPVNPKTNQP